MHEAMHVGEFSLSRIMQIIIFLLFNIFINYKINID